MKPVFMKQDNDCYPACLASILGLERDDVPNFFDGTEHRPKENAADAWNENVRAFLARFGLNFIVMEISEDYIRNIPGYLIISGMSPRGMLHATVWKDGKMVHDPHPDGGGIVAPYCLDLLFLTDPGEFVRMKKASEKEVDVNDLADAFQVEGFFDDHPLPAQRAKEVATFVVGYLGMKGREAGDDAA